MMFWKYELTLSFLKVALSQWGEAFSASFKIGSLNNEMFSLLSQIQDIINSCCF